MWTFNNKIMTFDGKWAHRYIDPYNPLELPPYTMRLLYEDGVTPSFSVGTAVQISQSPNIWDYTNVSPNWNALFIQHTSLLKVLGANVSGVTDFRSTFQYCSKLNEVALFDTSSVNILTGMFKGCSALPAVPKFDISHVTSLGAVFWSCSSLVSLPDWNTSHIQYWDDAFDGCSALEYIPETFDLTAAKNLSYTWAFCSSLKNIPNMNVSAVMDCSHTFAQCYKVESGAYAMYQKLSALSSLSDHSATFNQCGKDTVTGAAELAQIPTDWGGTMQV